MTSRIARALLPVPRQTGAVGDLLWRYSNYSEAEGILAAGCAPSVELLSELFMLNVSDVLKATGRLTPCPVALATAVSASAPASYLEGVAVNTAAPDEVLQALSAHADAAVAASAAQTIARRAELRSGMTQDSSSTAADVVAGREFQVMRSCFNGNENAFLGAIATSESHADALFAMKAFDASFHDEVLLAWVSGLEVPMTAYAAKWATSSALRAETLLGGASAQLLRRKATPAARSILETAGILPQTVPPASVPLEGMLLGLSPSEAAALIVGSQAPVSDSRIVESVLSGPATLAANFLQGACLRRPTPEQVLELVERASTEQRQQWSDSLVSSGLSGEDVSWLPWAGPLLLIGSLDFLESLGLAAALELNSVFQAKLGDSAAAWEFACVISEEWSGTIADLLDSSRAMEVTAS